MSTKEPSVEEIELWLRKVARGEVPNEGDVLIRANQGWIFSAPLLDMALLRWDGDLGTNVKPIGTSGFVKFSGSNAIPPDEADIYDDSASRGPGNLIEEHIEDGELLFKVSGLYTVSVAVTYENLVQQAQVRIGLIRGGITVTSIASSLADVQGAEPFFVASVNITTLFKAQDRVFVSFGRSGGQPFTADIINADLLAYLVAPDRIN